MFEDYAELRKLPEVAEMIAQDADWPELYVEKQLANNAVPVYAAVYLEDMYVDSSMSMDTAASIKGCKTFVTNMLYHDAVRSKTDEVMKQLFDLRDDCLD